jgi:endonuclease-3
MDEKEARKRIPTIISNLKNHLDIDEGPPWNRMDPFQCLIGTVLSARTRDENTARAAAALFRKYPDAPSLTKAPIKDVQRLVRPSGFYLVKAKRNKELSQYLLDHHKGIVPDNMDDLVRLPGVGRKTAGCVMVYSFKRPQIPVDVHLHRIPNRIGLLKTKTPEQTEQELMRLIPKQHWIITNHLFVRFGQQVCKPLRPECWHCPITRLCDYPDKNLSPPNKLVRK